MTLLAAFNTLLYRYTGQEDILVGSPIANRNRSETEGLIGFCQYLVLRTDLSRDPSFRELMRRVREVALGAYAHQDLPSRSWWRNYSRSGTQLRAPVSGVVRPSECSHASSKAFRTHP